MKKLTFVLFWGMAALSLSAWANKGVEPIEEIFEPAGFYDPAVYGKVAVVQWAGSAATPINVTVEEAERFKQGNREALKAYIEEAVAKGAEWVLTPEFATVGYPDIPELPSEEDNFQNREQVAPYVEEARGKSFQYFSAIAKEKKIWLHVGIVERDPLTDNYHNTVLVITPTGELKTTYRKMHLFQIEDQYLVPGAAPVIYESEFGHIAIAICSDIYSSVPMDYYAGQKVTAVALSTSWANWNTGMDAFRYAARWVNGYVLAANQNYFPDSGVINPDGSNQSHIRQTTGVAYGYLPRVKNLANASRGR